MKIIKLKKLIELISKTTYFETRDIELVITSLIEIIAILIANGDSVNINGLVKINQKENGINSSVSRSLKEKIKEVQRQL